MLRSAEVMHLVKRRAHEFGVRGVTPDAITFDLAAAVARKDAIVKGILSGIYDALKKNKNIAFFTGHAEFTSPVDIRVDSTPITAEKTILAVGSRSATVTIPGLAEVGYFTNHEALKLDRLPAFMIVIGGGYIGVEFAQMYARFGTKVTMLGRAPRVMPHED
ncbi:MAG: FAD-dependent oxidoreductase, partial [Chloroflexi bacterium]|nr:FAD-dependent oxidoreductase [Chloroflexota bacterium]